METENYTCRYCKKEFRRESTLVAHLCEAKRRWQQEREIGVQMGFRAYLRFYEITQGSAKLKTYEDFVGNSFYNAFVKFGRHCQAIRCVNYTSFSDWLLKNNKKIDNWCREDIYLEWLHQYVKKENVQDALERSLQEMQTYVDENPDLRGGLRDYFKFAGPNTVCYHISTGRVSPWVVFNCDTGLEFLERLNEEQVAIVMPWIDPDFWQQKFRDYLADVEWIKTILSEARL